TSTWKHGRMLDISSRQTIAAGASVIMKKQMPRPCQQPMMAICDSQLMTGHPKQPNSGFLHLACLYLPAVIQISPSLQPDNQIKI
ncbi:hypothetical protein LPJ68_005893, partial [Coemansia sp. RSA 1086]